MSLKLHTVTAYDDDFHDRFCRWRRARWTLAAADFTASSAHDGEGDGEVWRFGLRAIASRRRWALTLEHGRRRFAAVVVAPRPTCAEEIAAVALAAIAADGGPKVARVVDAGGLDREVFERFWAPLAPRRPAPVVPPAVAAAAAAAAVADLAAKAAALKANGPRLERNLHHVADAPMSADALRLCSGAVVTEFDGWPEPLALYLQRIDGADVLWQQLRDGHPKPRGAIPSAGDLATGAAALVAAAMRADVVWPFCSGSFRPGLLTEAQFRAAWQAKLDEKAMLEALAAADCNYPILIAARELGLYPQPSGNGPHSWLARCPGTNHMIMVQAKNGEFGCGWCKKRGGVAELRAFVAERTPPQKGRRKSKRAPRGPAAE
jgi:hypothetical protein